MKFANPHHEPVYIGVIGGTGVYTLACLENAHYYEIDTPFGKPSAAVCIAYVEGIACAFLPRHGVYHTLNPTEVNYRANICALKQLGVKYLLAISAVGSLDERYKPGDLVLVDQLIDKTIKRESTFFCGGIVAHVDFAHPISEIFSRLAFEAMKKCFTEDGVTFIANGADPMTGMNDSDDPDAFRVHASGTLVVMEGPQFSTKAESLMNKKSGGHLIGMTACPEAKLAREAEMAYALVAMVTDMDSWSELPHVSVPAVIKVIAKNVAKAERHPIAIIRALGGCLFDDLAHHALQFAITTKPEHISSELKERLAPLLAKYPQFMPSE